MSSSTGANSASLEYKERNSAPFDIWGSGLALATHSYLTTKDLPSNFIMALPFFFPATPDQYPFIPWWSGFTTLLLDTNPIAGDNSASLFDSGSSFDTEAAMNGIASGHCNPALLVCPSSIKMGNNNEEIVVGIDELCSSKRRDETIVGPNHEGTPGYIISVSDNAGRDNISTVERLAQCSNAVQSQSSIISNTERESESLSSYFEEAIGSCGLDPDLLNEQEEFFPDWICSDDEEVIAVVQPNKPNGPPPLRSKNHDINLAHLKDNQRLFPGSKHDAVIDLTCFDDEDEAIETTQTIIFIDPTYENGVYKGLSAGKSDSTICRTLTDDDSNLNHFDDDDKIFDEDDEVLSNTEEAIDYIDLTGIDDVEEIPRAKKRKSSISDKVVVKRRKLSYT
ncbi:hypothetical protein BKA67DRAFT_656779 [Truncatella angustata]|uniref:Uncharacterized protein n=1 Tax=Truncatella angustata TaxID=152316 RepID=A0A9P8UUJ1_9PEZI|nr:uncharacterized protein BKA67DRAFT_656779 [Truncatella angustata]KAH6658603.1 hypothetical protein BKA67DRAFT_656779 [Truncatella angustata]